MKRVFIFAIVALGVLFACKTKKAATTASDAPPAETTVVQVKESDECEGITPTYNNDISQILVQYCTKCHQGDRAPAGIDLTGYTTAMSVAKNGKLACVLKGESCKAMPPMGKIPEDDMQKMLCWIKNNAPH